MRYLILAILFISPCVNSQDSFDLKTPQGTLCITYNKSGDPISICKKSKSGKCLFDKNLGCEFGQGSKFKKQKEKNVNKKSIKAWKKGYFTPEIRGVVSSISQCKIEINESGGAKSNYYKVLFRSPVKLGEEVNEKIKGSDYINYVLSASRGMDHGGGTDSRGMDHGGGTDSRGMDHGGGTDSRKCKFKGVTLNNILLPPKYSLICESN